MPTYAYRCVDCDHAFDIHQAFTDDALTVCPACSGKLRKQFGSVGVTFKGAGFYRTDSRAGAQVGPARSKTAKKSVESSRPSETKKPASVPAGAN